MRIGLPVALLIAVWTAPGTAQQNLAGDWVVTLHDPFVPTVARLSLAVKGGGVTGSLSGRPLELAFTDGKLVFKVNDATATGSLENAELKGEAVFPDRTVKWTGVRMPAAPTAPRTHDFEPSQFHLYFSSKVAPPLRIHPGDTVRTWSVDAGGRDKQGTRRSAGGNPQTGPSYVEGALPNDTLVVRLNRVRLNRDWAQSGRTVVGRALEPGTVTLPLQPMLGCIGVAPPGELSIRTTDSGNFGGNMDYNHAVSAGLPPRRAAVPGRWTCGARDGELTGDALETSMDFEFTVDLIRDRSFGHPLAETAEFLISIGMVDPSTRRCSRRQAG